MADLMIYWTLSLLTRNENCDFGTFCTKSFNCTILCVFLYCVDCSYLTSDRADDAQQWRWATSSASQLSKQSSSVRSPNSMRTGDVRGRNNKAPVNNDSSAAGTSRSRRTSSNAGGNPGQSTSAPTVGQRRASTGHMQTAAGTALSLVTKEAAQLSFVGSRSSLQSLSRDDTQVQSFGANDAMSSAKKK